mgnify:CR=1 FL=1
MYFAIFIYFLIDILEISCNFAAAYDKNQRKYQKKTKYLWKKKLKF